MDLVWPAPRLASGYLGAVVAYDRGFLKVTWGFRIVNTDEIARTSLNFSDPADPTFNSAAALAEINMPVVGPLLLARMNTLMASASLFWATYSALDFVRIAAVDAAGVEFDPAKQFDDSTPAVGTASNIPAQVSLVMSTRSGSTAGSANFGRMYLPHCFIGMTTGTPRAAAATVATFATACQTFVSGVQADLDAVVTQSVLPTIMTQIVGGTSKRINQIAVGDIVDTQRRRRNALPEIYVFRSIP